MNKFLEVIFLASLTFSASVFAEFTNPDDTLVKSPSELIEGFPKLVRCHPDTQSPTDYKNCLESNARLIRSHYSPAGHGFVVQSCRDIAADSGTMYVTTSQCDDLENDVLSLRSPLVQVAEVQSDDLAGSPWKSNDDNARININNRSISQEPGKNTGL